MKFNVKNHTIRMVNYSKNVLNNVDVSSRYLSCTLCNTPFCYFDKNEKCKSLECEKDLLFLSIYNRLCVKNNK